MIFFKKNIFILSTQECSHISFQKTRKIIFDGSYFFFYIYNMIYVLIYLCSVILSIVWLSYEIWKSPEVDNSGNIIKPEKRFVDLLKIIKLWK